MKTKTLIKPLLICCCFLSIGTAEYPQTPTINQRPNQDRALFFAVSDYEDDGLTDLPQPIKNAEAIAGVLEERFGFETEVVVNPTLVKIQAKLLEYQNKYANNTFATDGQLFIFFSGHGVKEYGAGYFLPADADPDLVISTGLPYNTWRGFVDNINCQHILVAIDACYSVTFDPDWGSMGDDDSRFRRKNEMSENERELANHAEFPSRLFYTSDAQEDVTPGRSNFARKLLEGLNKPRGTTGYLTAEELFASYVKRAQPTPNAGDFGRDDVRSNFLFFHKQNKVNIGDAQADYAAWQIAQQTNTLPAYRQYLSDYPNGDFSFTAQEEIARLENEERELTAWSQAKTTNTPQAYADFVNTYPKSRYAAEAQRRQVVAQNDIQITTTPSIDRESRSGSTTAPDNFIRIPGGTYQMGDQYGEGDDDEKPVHTVEVSTFYLSPTEVTFAEYDAFCEATGRSKPDDENWGRDQRPAINVSWCDAVEYANWLSTKNGLQTVYSGNCDNIRANWEANGYRLPTEAEWEYAARQGGQKVRFGNGKDIADPAEINFDGNWNPKSYSKEGIDRQKTVPVGSLNSPNSLGLHDMSGNVWEWCWDWYGDYPSSAQQNPRGPESGSGRVKRGGSWSDSPANVRCSDRSGGSPGDRDYNIGFRLARAGR
jgi:formylglycine-generating enzyme required for sulfatase activity